MQWHSPFVVGCRRWVGIARGVSKRRGGGGGGDWVVRGGVVVVSDAHQGSRHWKWQRITALALAPLTLWFVFAIVDRVTDSHHAVQAWIAQPAVAIALLAYLPCMFMHAQLGLQVVFEDYVAAPNTRKKIIGGLAVINTLACLAAMAAVVWVAFL